MASPYDIQRQNQQGVADAVAGLGEILLGNPQLDAQLAQGQAQMALRNKRMAEAEAAEQEAAQSMMNQDRASRVYHQLAATDPNSPDFQRNLANNMALLMGTGAYDDPAKYGAVARLFTNIGGGDINQIARGETDLSKLVELEELEDTRAQREALGNVIASLGQQGGQSGSPLGADAVQAVLQSDLPDFQKQMVADIFYNNTDPSRAASVAMGNIRPMQNEATGAAYNFNLSTDERYPVYDPAEVDIARLGTPGGAADVFSEGMPPSQEISGVPSQPPGQGTPGQQSNASAPQMPTQPEGAQQPGVQTPEQMPAPETTEPGGMPPLRVQEPSEAYKDVYGEGIDYKQERTAAGMVDQLFTPEGEPLTMFDLLENMSGMGASAKWWMTKGPGQFIGSLSFPETDVAKTVRTRMAAELRPLMTVSNRPSMWELKNIEEAIASGTFWENMESAAAQTAQLYQELRQGREKAVNALTQRNSGLTMERRNELRAQIQHADSLIRKIGTPRQVNAAEVNQEHFQDLWRGAKQAVGVGSEGDQDVDAQIQQLPAEDLEYLRGGQ